MATAIPYAAFALGTYMANKNKPQIPQPPAPIAPPQPSQMPNVQGTAQSLMGAGQAGGKAGLAQTYLTGAGGINPAGLTLSKPSLLGA